MRLRKIKLKSDFRSLKSGFELHFLDGIPKFQELNPYCIVGRNGSGKSNILELLSSIFYSLELRCLNYLPEIFEDIDTKIQSPNAYELEYFINNCHIKIDKRNQKPDKKDNRQTNESIINFFHFAFSFPLLYLYYSIS